MKNFMKEFEMLTRKRSSIEVFNDFISMVVCSLSRGTMEDEYRAIISKYSQKELKIFPSLYAEMIIGMEGKQDFLGQVYMELNNKSKAKSFGQFFTPQHVCDFMVSILMGDKINSKKVCDPTCGSGRMFLAFSKDFRTKDNLTHEFIGMDIDLTCVKMAVINCTLNGLFGQIYHMNTLTNEYFGAYKIGLRDGIPMIEKATEEMIDKWNIMGNGLVDNIIKKSKIENTQLTLF